MFSSLSASEARRAYDGAVHGLVQQLKDRGVSDEDIEAMSSISSDSLMRLRPDFPTRSAWLQEWLISKCGPEITPDLGKPDKEFWESRIASVKRVDCTLHAMRLEAKRVQGK
jgi:hypothetical protein